MTENNKFRIPVFFKIIILIGLIMIFFGGKSLLTYLIKTKDYVVISGICVKHEKYKSEDGYNYKAVYMYEINNKKYNIEDNTLNKIPK